MLCEHHSPSQCIDHCINFAFKVPEFKVLNRVFLSQRAGFKACYLCIQLHIVLVCDVRHTGLLAYFPHIFPLSQKVKHKSQKHKKPSV